MISVAVTTYTRSSYTVDSFIKVLDNPVIDEVVVVDDSSEQGIFLRLRSLITDINNGKIKLYRNKTNMGPLLNKYETIKQCTNKWVILLDSDNILDNNYIDVINGLHKEENILYCPSKLVSFGDGSNVKWNYGDYSDMFIDKKIVNEHSKDVNFMTMLNTGNYLVNRNKYIEVMSHNNIDVNLVTNDAVYFSYLWITYGNFIKVVPDLSYMHRIHKGSWYLNNRHTCDNVMHEIIEKFKQ